MTPKRMEVYTSLLVADQPLSAYELIDRVKAIFGRQLTPISIYRMLDFLEQRHLVRKLKSAAKYIAINLDGQPFDQPSGKKALQFLICRACGEVKELGVDQAVLAELKACIETSGFQLSTMELELECLCTHCVNTESTEDIKSIGSDAADKP